MFAYVFRSYKITLHGGNVCKKVQYFEIQNDIIVDHSSYDLIRSPIFSAYILFYLFFNINYKTLPNYDCLLS